MCTRTEACMPYRLAPQCVCGGEMERAHEPPTQGEARTCVGLMGQRPCGQRYDFRSRTWMPAGREPAAQRPPEKVRQHPRHLRSVA